MVALSHREEGHQRIKAYLCRGCYTFHTLDGIALMEITGLVNHNIDSTGKEIYDRIFQSHEFLRTPTQEHP
jgi:hypothetical protein